MNTFKSLRPILSCLVVAPTLVGLTSIRQSSPIVITPFKAGAVYDLGERVGWTVTLPSGPTTGLPTYHYVVKRNNSVVVRTGDLDLSTGKADINVDAREPEMLIVELKSDDKSIPGLTAGAAVAPTKLKPVLPRPRDFDAFWKGKIQALEAIPANPVLTPKNVGNPNVEYSTIQMDHVNGKHVYGQFAKPKGDGKFPALVIFQWASPPYPLQPYWVTQPASNGWITLNIEPHNVLPDQPQSYYSALPNELKNYTGVGQDDRDKCYFLDMYLADYRAVEYIASRPDWDGKTLVVMGTSMGGQQSLCVAGLNPKVTHVIVNEPAGCDLNGNQHGRQAGYPNFQTQNPKVAETAPYFDAVNFASHIRATSLVAMGFLDTAAPPAGVWTAYNLIKGKKEAAPMFDSPHNNLATPAQQRPFTFRSAQWLDALVHGRAIPKPIDHSN